MRLKTQCRNLLAGSIVAALTAAPATAAITVLHEWNLGDNDTVSAGDTVTTSLDNVGSNNLSPAGTDGTISYVNTPVAGLGVALSNVGSDGGTNGTDGAAASDYLQSGINFTPTSGQNWGVEAWIKLNTNPSAEFDETIFSFTDAGTGFAYGAINTSGGWSYLAPNIALFAPAGSTADATGSWSHLVFISDNGTLAIYQDGVDVTGGSQSAFTSGEIQNFRIGANQAGNGGFDGEIGAVRVFEFGVGQFDINDTLVPEPGSMALILAGMGLVLRRRRQA